MSLIQATAKKVADSVTQFDTYIRRNREFIPNFGERRRQGETISTAFVESTINQVVSRRFVKKQQMQWTIRGAHLLLQTRTKVLNDELDATFRRLVPKVQASAKNGGRISKGRLTPDLLTLSKETCLKSNVDGHLSPLISPMLVTPLF